MNIKILVDSSKRITSYTALCIILILGIIACKEGSRFEISSGDSEPPEVPVVRKITPLYGGARIFYDIPSDEDLMSVNAEFKAANGELFVFSASYFADSLDVYGLGDTEEHVLSLYAVDRSGNKSEIVPVPVVPLEPSITRVARTLVVKPGFSSFYVDWENELEQIVNIYVDFEFKQDGVDRDLIMVFSSNLLAERRFINDLDIPSTEPVKVKIRVEDIYGNTTESIDFGELYLFEDSKIPKTDWVLPQTNDSIAGAPMCYGSAFDGRIYRVIDDAIDIYQGSNYMHTGGLGRTGMAINGNVPWSLIIDMGDYYELSRIVTHQRHFEGTNYQPYDRGHYYREANVGKFNMYYLDEDTNEWILISQHIIPVPTGLSDIEIAKQGDAGDMAYMYPDDPDFTKPTRWFRYEALSSFDSNYTATNANTLSEVTLYGRKATNVK